MVSSKFTHKAKTAPPPKDCVVPPPPPPIFPPDSSWGWIDATWTTPPSVEHHFSAPWTAHAVNGGQYYGKDPPWAPNFTMDLVLLKPPSRMKVLLDLCDGPTTQHLEALAVPIGWGTHRRYLVSSWDSQSHPGSATCTVYL